MKLLLIALNRETHPYPVQPIGLAYIAAAAREAGHDVSLLDLNMLPDPMSALEKRIADFAPEVIGLGLRNIDNCVFPKLEFYLPWAQEVVTRCRQLSSAQLVIGGSGFGVMPREILEYLDLEIGILGEGEKNILELLEVFRHGRREQLDHTGGLALRRGAEYRETPRSFFAFGLQDFFPARDLLDLPSYLAAGSLTAVQAKRGCALRCSYCTYPLLEGRDIRMRSAKHVVDELEHLQSHYGVEDFFFTDNVFNNPIEHAIEICREIVERGLKLSWTGFINPAFMTPEFANWAARSGCSGIEFGTEGGTATSLKALRKGFSVKRLIESHQIASEAGLKTCHYLIVGSPGETFPIIREGLDLIASLHPTAVIVSTGIRIYPNTAIAKTAQQEGYEIDNLLIPQFYFPACMRDDPAAAIEMLAKEYPRFRFEGFHSRPTLTLLRALRRRGHRGPTWLMPSLWGAIMARSANAAPTAAANAGAPTLQHIHAQLANLDPLRRNLLSCQGTLQEALAVHFQTPIYVRIARQRLEPETQHIFREVDLVRDSDNTSVCRATTEIEVQDTKARQLVLEQQLGLGQIFHILQLETQFTLEAIGEDPTSFWRSYRLSAPGICCRIREEFPRRLF